MKRFRFWITAALMVAGCIATGCLSSHLRARRPRAGLARLPRRRLSVRPFADVEDAHRDEPEGRHDLERRAADRQEDQVGAGDAPLLPGRDGLLLHIGEHVPGPVDLDPGDECPAQVGDPLDQVTTALDRIEGAGVHPPALVDLVGGNVDVFFDNISSSAQFHTGNKLHILTSDWKLSGKSDRTGFRLEGPEWSFTRKAIEKLYEVKVLGVRTMARAECFNMHGTVDNPRVRARNGALKQQAQ